MTYTNLSFDGFGINGYDEYRTRLATLNPSYPKGAELLRKIAECYDALPTAISRIRVAELDCIYMADRTTGDDREAWLVGAREHERVRELLEKLL